MCRVQESLYILAVCVRTRGKDTRMGMRVDMCMGHVHRHGHGHVCRRVPLMSGLAMCAAHVWEPVRCGFSEIRQYNSGLHSCGLYAIVVWPIYFFGNRCGVASQRFASCNNPSTICTGYARSIARRFATCLACRTALHAQQIGSAGTPRDGDDPRIDIGHTRCKRSMRRS